MEKVIGPAEILRLPADDADRLFDLLEARVPTHPTLFDLSSLRADEAIVFGDSHGDWRSVERVVARYEDPARRRLLIGLGDYLDRTPEDCGAGAVASALYLLQLAARDPDRVVLLRGNHETVRVIPFTPESVRGEILELWGSDPRRYERLIDLLGRGPLAAFHPSGPYLAHAGIPGGDGGKDWKAAFDRVDERLVAEITWTDCAASRNRRGGVDPLDEARLAEFLTRADLTFMLRGHDPDITGRRLFHDRCLTLHTTRVYERFGGVVLARLPLDRPRISLADVRVEHVETEGQRYPAPSARPSREGRA
ncbi:MAG: metallophosphoesterase family protein [Thermoplasmata archaeon]